MRLLGCPTRHRPAKVQGIRTGTRFKRGPSRVRPRYRLVRDGFYSMWSFSKDQIAVRSHFVVAPRVNLWLKSFDEFDLTIDNSLKHHRLGCIAIRIKGNRASYS